MSKVYKLRNAFTLNATGAKVNVIASPAFKQEINRHQQYFNFDFSNMLKDFIVYKFTVAEQPGFIQALVAFRATPGVLDCANMETNRHNRKPAPVYGNTGKAIVAFCCKYSIDNGMDGYITFESKGRLRGYYLRLGANFISPVKMYIDTKGAQKLIVLYF